jgi:hypothetical protein
VDHPQAHQRQAQSDAHTQHGALTAAVVPLVLLNQLQQLLDVFRLYPGVCIVYQFNCTKDQTHANGFIQPPLLTGINNDRLAHDQNPR